MDIVKHISKIYYIFHTKKTSKILENLPKPFCTGQQIHVLNSKFIRKQEVNAGKILLLLLCFFILQNTTYVYLL